MRLKSGVRAIAIRRGHASRSCRYTRTFGAEEQEYGRLDQYQVFVPSVGWRYPRAEHKARMPDIWTAKDSQVPVARLGPTTVRAEVHYGPQGMALSNGIRLSTLDTGQPEVTVCHSPRLALASRTRRCRFGQLEGPSDPGQRHQSTQRMIQRMLRRMCGLLSAYQLYCAKSIPELEDVRSRPWHTSFHQSPASP